MFPAHLSGGALALGQPPAPSESEPLNLLLTVPAPAASPAAPAANPPSPPDRWFLMKSLQGFWTGELLDDNRLSVSGWTEVSLTASTDRRDQLPMGFNFRAS